MGGGASKQKAVSPPVNTVKSVNTNSELASAQKVNSETTLVQECSNQPHSKPSSEQASIKLPQILDKKHHDNALKNEHVPAKDAPTQNKVITDTGLNNDAIVSEPSEQQNSIGTEILDTGQETEDHNSTYEQQDVHLPEFAQTIRWCNEMVTSHSILHQATDDLLHLQISRSLPAHIDISELLNKLHNLQSLDLSKQLMGPQAFRAIVLGMAQNTFITQLNLANNQTDTDSAACLGSMLSSNATLQYLDVSGNNLGKDYFSRCVGKAMENNNTLTTLICDGIGSTDMLPLVASFQGNCRLTELNVSHNEFTEGAKFIQELNKSLKNQDCCLKTLEMKCCGFTGDDFKILQEGISKNSSLITLNLAANQVSTTGIFMDFLVCCISHPTLEHVTLDDTRIQSAGAWKPAGGTQPHTTESSLYHLSLSACGITDKIAEQLLNVTGSLRSLKELTLNNNPELTVKGVGTVMKLSNGGIEKLSLALCSITNVSDILTNNDCLKYLNLRKCKISAAEVGKIGGLTKRLRMFTLVLDGLKLSGSKAIEKLVDDSSSDLVALSLGGCQLSDEDVKPLISAIKSGLPLSMLKLSGNRVTDVTIDGLIESIGQSAIGVHQMKLLDISNNKITSVGARKISEALENSKTVLHSLNLSHNNIDYEGICSLVSKVNITTLLTLQLNDQQETLEDEESDDVCKQLAQTLGFSVPDQVEDLRADSSELPEIKSGVFVKLSGLGGCGTYAQYLDCAAILTDLEKSNVRTLCLSDALKITAYLKGQAGGESCLLSASEWTDIIGSSGDVPSWLQVSDSRACGLYLTFLPAAVTVPKLEGTLESDADCNVQEVYLMKDVISKKNTGVGWALLSDVESTQRAVEYMRNGEALIFSQPFLISKIDVKINDEENSKAAEKAKRDIAARVANQAKDSNAHRKLIAQSYQTSQARYAHQLANPAYTDGRVW